MNSQPQQSKGYEYGSTDSIITPQEIYQTLIRQTPNLYPLCKFKTKGSNKHIFPDAVKFPDFFNYNLVSPGRVIKKLEGKNSLIRGFYYQLMKLAFEIQIEGKDYFEILKNVIFSPQFMLEETPSSPSSGKTYSDLQYKKILAQFMEILIQQSIPNFQLTILNYLIVDEAMVKIFQNLLQFKNPIGYKVNSNNTSYQMLKLLCETFQVTVIQHGNCYKFDQSDIFLYEHSKNQFYIAYLNEMAQVSDGSDNSNNKESKCSEDISKQNVQQLDYQMNKEVKTHEYLQINLDKIQKQIRRSQKLSSINVPDQVQQFRQIRQKFALNEIKTLQSIVSKDDEIIKKDIISSERNKILIEIKEKDNHESSFINELHALEGEDHVEMDSKYKFQQKKQKQLATNQNSMFDYYGLTNNSNKITINSKIITNKKYEYQPRGYKSTSKLISTHTQSKGITERAMIRQDNQIVKRVSSCEKKFDFLNSNGKEKVIKGGQTQKTHLHTHPPYHSNNGLHNYQLESTTKPQLQLNKIQPNSLLNKQPSTKQSNSKTDDDIFYTPKSLIPKPEFLIQLSSGNHKKQKQKYQSLGTLYRQFTETKILQALPEKVRQNVRKMKSKYKGVRSKDFFSGKVI